MEATTQTLTFEVDVRHTADDGTASPTGNDIESALRDALEARGFTDVEVDATQL